MVLELRLIIILVFSFFVCCAEAYTQIRLSPEEANKLVIEKQEPEYPAIAKLLKLQEKVNVDATISESGSVVSAKALNGNPALKDAAVKAVMKNRYKPHLVDGKPTLFVTTVEVKFSLGIPDEEYERDRKFAEQYFKQADKCRRLVRSENWNEAESVCKGAVELAEMFGNGRELEKMGAYELAGHVMRGRKSYREALDYYSRARAVVRSRLDDKDAELGRLYGDMAITHHLLRDLDKARELYRQAERVLQAAYDKMGREPVDEEIQDIRRGYIKSLRKLLEYHLLAAEDAGVSSELQEIKNLIKNLP
jgi:TonB family protein